MTLRVWCSGQDLPSTGVGVIQRVMHDALKRRADWALIFGPERPSMSGWWATLKYKVKQVAADTRGADVALITSSPRPWRLHPPYVSVVYDLRWLRTAPRLKAWYRRYDLGRTTKDAVRVLVISQRTRDDLLHLRPTLADRVALLPLGPGQCTTDDFVQGEPGTVLLIGSGPHKRNRVMIEALASARPSWFERLVCVNLSPVDVALAEREFGVECVEVLTNLEPGQMVEQFKRADVYASLSVEEGFGLPYIEAMAAGARVLAVDQPLTRELLGLAGALISDGDTAAIAAQLEGVQWPDPDARRQCATRYSWDATVRAVVTALEEATA